MQNVFLELVKLSLIGSLFAAAVMLVRLVFRKAPKWLFCVLWGVVALRLICPISIESNVSLVPDRLATGQIITNVGNEYIGDVDIIYESNAGYNNAIDAGRQPIYSNDGYYVVTEKDSLEAPKTVGQTVYPVLSWIWVAGMILMLAYTAVSYLLLRKKMEEATQLRDNIWQCEQVDSPFVLGFIKPRIYLPYAITDSDMANVIAHEQAHIQRKDHWWKPIGFLLLSIHWFNPVLWLAYILLCRDIEAACDEKVIKHMEKDEMRAYSTALLHCSVHRRRIAACPLAFGETGVKERIKRVMNYKKPAFWIIISAVVLCSVVAVCFLTTPAASSEFAMNGNNVSDLNVDEIITHIRKVQRLGDGNAYTNPGNFSLTIDSDFNWVDSQAVRYFFYKEHGVHSAQVRIFPDEEKVFLTESSEWLEQDQVFLLRHYLDAVKYLPQDEISQMAPADKYLIRHVAEGRPSSYSRVITYTPNGAENTDDWLIHLQLEPLHAAEEGYVGTGEEVIHLFYADKTDTVGDISKLLALVNSIANNPDCAASSNPFTFIEAKKPVYNEILTYGSTAVDFFVEQLRTGENGLQGYIMAVACADITGIGDKDLGADWGTAQEWLALYDKSDKGTIIPPVIATDYISGKQAQLLSFGYTSDKAGQSLIACGIAPYQGDYSDNNTLVLDGESGQNQILLTPKGASFSRYRIYLPDGTVYDDGTRHIYDSLGLRVMYSNQGVCLIAPFQTGEYIYEVVLSWPEQGLTVTYGLKVVMTGEESDYDRALDSVFDAYGEGNPLIAVSLVDKYAIGNAVSHSPRYLFKVENIPNAPIWVEVSQITGEIIAEVDDPGQWIGDPPYIENQSQFFTENDIIRVWDNHHPDDSERYRYFSINVPVLDNALIEYREDSKIYINGEYLLGGPGNGCESFYLTDLTGDAIPELCFGMNAGSGIVDYNIVIVDYVTKNTIFTLSDRMFHDYYLFSRNDVLCVKETEYTKSDATRTGVLVYDGSRISVKWDAAVNVGQMQSERTGAKVHVVDIWDQTTREQISCASALEKFWEDETNEYYFSCIKSQYIMVMDSTGRIVDVVTALEDGLITIETLDYYGIGYSKQPKT